MGKLEINEGAGREGWENGRLGWELCVGKAQHTDSLCLGDNFCFALSLPHEFLFQINKLTTSSTDY